MEWWFSFLFSVVIGIIISAFIFKWMKEQEE